ncbi:tyrosine-type recombinase/integrase [Propionibacteriaceae bacterium Y2011]
MVDIWKAGKQHLARKSVLAAKADASRVRARWGTVPVTEVRHDEVQVWIASMTSERGKGDRLVVRPAANATRAKALQCLRGALKIAIDRGMLDKNPCEGINPGQLRRVEPQYLEADELVALAVGAGVYRAMVMMLGTTGIRVGEAAALNVGDVDVRRRRARVRKSKTGMARDVPVPASVLAMLPLERAKGEPLFTAPRGGRVDVDNWRERVWEPLVPSGFRIHDLRHTAASLAIASGADVKAVQRMLGHATAAMTLDLYSHLWDRGLDDVAAVRMDGLLSGGDA